LNRVRLMIMAVVLVPLLIIAGYVLLFDSTQFGASSSGAHYTSFSAAGKSFELTYVATNQTALQKGLMDTKVENDTTMLFVFPTSDYYSFWMFGVNSSLDMMWVETPPGSNAGSVVYLVAEAPPCHVAVACTSYQPNAKADFVIEAKGGFAKANGIGVGTGVILR
jgi:uncharacterized membrane protein (UPF0127 family)